MSQWWHFWFSSLPSSAATHSYSRRTWQNQWAISHLPIFPSTDYFFACSLPLTRRSSTDQSCVGLAWSEGRCKGCFPLQSTSLCYWIDCLDYYPLIVVAKFNKACILFMFHHQMYFTVMQPLAHPIHIDCDCCMLHYSNIYVHVRALRVFSSWTNWAKCCMVFSGFESPLRIHEKKLCKKLRMRCSCFRGNRS